MDRPRELAVVLRAAGARFRVVGSASVPGSRPRDLDVVVARADAGGLRRALADLGSALPPLRVSPVRVDTSYGPLDVFVA